MTSSTSGSSPILSSTSLSGLGLTGLSSGLDTSSIISKLMSIESEPQTLLQNQLTNVTAYTSALQGVNSQLAAITTAAQSAATAGALASFTATSDTSGVTAAASSTASAGSVSFTVDKVAAAQVSVTGAMATWPAPADPDDTLAVTITPSGAGSPITVHPASTSLDDVVSAINGGGTGVTATKVSAGTVNGVAQYRIQLRSNATGAAGAFSISDSDGATVPTTTITTAQDAQLTLYSGTSAAQVVTSSSNTFTGLMTGVDVTVSAPTSSAATISVAADSSKAVSAASSLTASLISFFSTIASDTAITTSSSSSGGTSSSSTTGSVFTGDMLVRNVTSAMLDAATNPVNGQSPSSIGITLTKDGTITFDQSAFTAAMASDPTGTLATFQTIAGRVADAGTAASDPYTGTVSQQVTSSQSQESDLNTQISDWSTRLAAIQQNYETQFDNLETSLSNLSSQASYLTSQLGGLTTDYGSF